MTSFSARFCSSTHHANGQKTWSEKKKKRWKDMRSECQPGNDQQLQRLSDRIRTAKNRGRERDGRSRFRNFVALTLGWGERQPKKRHRSPPCVSPGTKKDPNIFRVRQMFYAQNSLAFPLLLGVILFFILENANIIFSPPFPWLFSFCLTHSRQ